jgi:Pyruvate/2-oxoacid:ferredoxin oxidoreductase delta subunit
MEQFLTEDTKQKAKEIQENRAKKLPRKKQPLKLAVIDQSGCTGCEACIVFCPVDCIEIVPGYEHTQLQQIVEVDLDRCIGCALCAKHCPWDTIDMFNYEEGLKAAPQETIKSICGYKTQINS